MNKTTDSIEVPKTTLVDYRKMHVQSIIISSIASVVFAITTHLYFVSLVLFLVLGLFDPRVYVNLRTPYRFVFRDGYVHVFYTFYGKEKIKKVPFEQFVIIKKYWHKKKCNQEYTVSVSDIKHPDFFSFHMPGLDSMSHWDKDALEYLLHLAEINGITIKRWDYPIRWGS